MVTKEELYISFNPEDYKTNKSNILMCRANLLETLKRLHNLKVLSKQKRDLKIKLHKLLTSVLSEIDSVENKMPTPKIPKEIKISNEPKSKLKESFSGHEGIEEELRLIQEKLRELNS